MLFCDSCDLGYHMSCHRPQIFRKPQGRWECDSCAAETGYRGEIDEKFNPPGASTFFEELIPALPPGISQWPALGFTNKFYPDPDQYPPHWEDLPVEKSIPDIAGWSAARMSQYLVQNGVKEKDAKIFFEQVKLQDYFLVFFSSFFFLYIITGYLLISVTLPFLKVHPIDSSRIPDS